MNNEELKKKIKEVLRKRMTELLGSCQTDEISLDEEGKEAVLFYADEFADALIAAGIGDVSKHRFFISKDGTEIKQLYSGEEVERIAKERDEYKHRTEVAERALYKACKDIKDICEYLVKFGGTGVITIESYAPEQSEPSAYIDRAEKELAEEGKDD